jgi:hypothetical protein
MQPTHSSSATGTHAGFRGAACHGNGSSGHSDTDASFTATATEQDATDNR